MVEYCCGADGISYAACVNGVLYQIEHVVVNASGLEVLALFENVFCIVSHDSAYFRENACHDA